MLLAMARDIRVILVKLCDRLDNMRTLAHMPPEKQERIAARDDGDLRAARQPPRHPWIKVELEDLSFKYLHPGSTSSSRPSSRSLRPSAPSTSTTVEDLIAKELRANGVECDVSGRAKHFWSIFQKMRQDRAQLRQIHDASAFRAVVIARCASATRRSASRTQTSGRRSRGASRTTSRCPSPTCTSRCTPAVIGPAAERIEVQIRTAEMHRIAEDGIAAHWKYKEGKPHGARATRRSSRGSAS
jgi:guanosine-3',5'-bis(diphosphate) 3'-pyrophosphohydrolase